MIEIFEGRLGGGKSYSGTVRVIAQLVRGGVSCTNIDIQPEAVRDYCARYHNVIVESDQLIVLDNHQISEFHKHTPSGTSDLPVQVVVDEAHIFFNSRDWNKASRELLMFLTQSRKVHTDVIFISQSMLNMDKQFARLVQFVWRFRDMERWKLPLLGMRYPFPHIMALQFDYDGRTILKRSMIWKRKEIFACYRTNALVHEFPRLEGVTTKRQLQTAHTTFWGAVKKGINESKQKRSTTEVSAGVASATTSAVSSSVS